MKRIIALIALLLLIPTLTWAMSQSSVPPKFPIPWANSAGSAYVRSIPQNSQIGIQNCAASLTDGFPPLTFVPSGAGGCPPFGQDMNGILKQLSQWGLWQAAGSPTAYDSSFSSSIGGYPKGAVVANTTAAGCFYLSMIDNNSSNPTSGGANWVSYCVNVNASGGAPMSSGSANAQTVTVNPFTLQAGSSVTFIAGFSNTGPLQLNVNGAGLVNVFRRSQLGATMSVGGEVVLNEIVTVQWDGTEWQCVSCAKVKVGSSTDYFGTSAPAGTLFEDGRCVSQATYADLYGIIGNNYGSCSAGNFALPDTRGIALVGLDNQGSNGAANRLTSSGSACNGTTIGTICGAQNRVIAINQMPAHTHAVYLNDPGHSHNVGYNNSGPGGGSSPYVVSSLANTFATSVSTTGITIHDSPGGAGNLNQTASTGGSTPLTTVQPTLVATKVIQF